MLTHEVNRTARALQLMRLKILTR